MKQETVKVFGLDRHRIGIDGEGVTTLVTLHGCPLRCKYCINPQCNDAEYHCIELTAEKTVELCMKDNLYFLATGGGLTVGGGEPLLHPQYIEELRRAMPEEWKLNIETSLNVPQKNIEHIADSVNYFIIDVKDMNPEIYIKYTGRENQLVINNLRYIAERGLQDKCKLRLPLILYYNKEKDREASKAKLEALGFANFDEFEYRVDSEVK